MADERMPRRPAVAAGIAGLIAFFIFSLYLLALPEIPDGDSYYHLGIARHYARHGIAGDFPWARFSVMAQGFGDKELLFHLLTTPFAAGENVEETGRIAVAFFNACLVALLAWLGIRALGWWGLFVPAIVYLGSTSYWGRVMRLRPEVLALLLLVAATWLASRKRYVGLLIVSFLFALSYTAAQVIVGLGVILVAVEFVRERRVEWKLVAAPLAGVGAGLLIHPHFPHNLRVWWYQNVLYFAEKHRLDIGPEILPPAAATVLIANAPVIIALAAMGFGSAKTELRDDLRRAALFFAIAAGAFLLLYALMARMSTYAVPFTVLAVVYQLAYRRIVRPVPTVVGMVAALGLSLFHSQSPFREALGGVHYTEMKYAAIGKAIPDGAKVAADWRDGEAMVFFAPQGRYLNVLDPIFMAIPHPRAYALQQALWAGKTPDVPVVVRALDSDYLLFQQSEELEARVSNDPRIAPLYTRGAFLGRVQPASPAFLLDWLFDGQAYPRAAEPRIREVEGFVDVSRIPNARPCQSAVHTFGQQDARRVVLEFAPFGPSSLEIDGRLMIATRGEMKAILGQGIELPVDLSAGPHTIGVTTCRAGPDRPQGFYLVIR